MGTVIGLRGHPGFKTASDRKFEAFMKEWAEHVLKPVPPTAEVIEFPRPNTGDEVTFTLDWSAYKSGVDKMGEDCDG